VDGQLCCPGRRRHYRRCRRSGKVLESVLELEGFVWAILKLLTAFWAGHGDAMRPIRIQDLLVGVALTVN